MGSRVRLGLGFGVQGLGSRVWVRVWGLGLGSRVQGWDCGGGGGGGGMVDYKL